MSSPPTWWPRSVWHRAQHDIDFLPGSAELGDFDATSTTVMLEPTGLAGQLPREAVEATFARYLRRVRGAP